MGRPGDTFGFDEVTREVGGTETLAPPDEGQPTPAAPRWSEPEDALLGAGGLGEVRRRLDAWLGREVAVKTLRPGAGPGAERRFLREARVTAQLEHPGIVPVYDLGPPDGPPSYTMRRVRGRTLAAAIAAAPDLSARLALLVHVVDLCQAVAYAHSRGVLHRDLKPQNVMVGEFGETVLLDWGLARKRNDAEGDGYEVVSLDPGQTIVGATVGTPAYMSPEQANGEPVDERADVWSLGAVLYAVVTGTAPYVGNLEEVLAFARAGRPAAVRTRVPIDAPLGSIIDQALARDRDLRYPSAAALAADLSAWQSGAPVAAHRYTLTERIGRWIGRNTGAFTVGGVAAVAGLILVSAGGVILADQRDRARAAEQAARDAELEAERRLAVSLVERAEAAWDARSPRAALYAAGSLAIAERPAARGILLAAVSGWVPRLDTSQTVPGGCRGVAAEGARIAAACADGVHLWDREERVLGQGPYFSVALGGGRVVASAGSATLQAWEIGDGTTRTWTLRGEDGHPIGGWDLRGLSVDGVDAVVLGEGTAWRWALDRDDPPVPWTDGVKALARQGDTLLLGGNGALTRLEAGVARPAGTTTRSVIAVALAPGGELVASFGDYFGGDRKVHVLDGQGASVTTLSGPVGEGRSLAFSPDGTLLAAASDEAAVHVWETTTWRRVARLEVAGSFVRQVAFSAGGLVAATDAGITRWSVPVEARDAWLAGHSASVMGVGFAPDGIWTADERGTARRWTFPAGRPVEVRTSPEGRAYAFDLDPDGNPVLAGARIWRLLADGPQAWPGVGGAASGLDASAAGMAFSDWSGDFGVAEVDRAVVRWSRRALPAGLGAHLVDGRLVLVSPDGGLATWDAASGAPGQTWNLGIHPVGDLSAAGTRVLVHGDDGRVQLVDLRTGPGPIWEGHAGPVLASAWSPDQRLVATAGRDRIVRIRAVGDGTVLAEIPAHDADVWGMAWSPDGRWLVTTSADRRVGTWDLALLERSGPEALTEVEARTGARLDGAAVVASGSR